MKLATFGMGIIALSLAAASHASNPVTVSIGGATPVTLTSLTDTFSGPASLTKTCGVLPIQVSCTLAVTGTIDDDGVNTTDLTITSATSTGSGLCNNITFNNFDWTGSANHDQLPTAGNPNLSVPFTVSGIEVNTSCGACGGSLTATYTNAGGGTFGFSGSLPWIGGGLPGPCNVASTGLNGSTTYYIVH